MARHGKGGGVKTAIVAMVLLISPLAPAGEWWREDGGRSWGADGNRGDAAWGESREEAWWLDENTPPPRERYGDPRGDNDSGRQPWGLRDAPTTQEQSRKTYNPWSSDWSDRPWGGIGSRSERDSETNRRRGARRGGAGAPGDGGTPHPGYGPAPPYAPAYVPGYAEPWGGMPSFPPLPAPYPY